MCVQDRGEQHEVRGETGRDDGDIDEWMMRRVNVQTDDVAGDARERACETHYQLSRRIISIKHVML